MIIRGTISCLACEVSKICKQEHGSADIPTIIDHENKYASLKRSQNETTRSEEFGHITTVCSVRIGCVFGTEEQ